MRLCCKVRCETRCTILVLLPNSSGSHVFFKGTNKLVYNTREKEKKGEGKEEMKKSGQEEKREREKYRVPKSHLFIPLNTILI